MPRFASRLLISIIAMLPVAPAMAEQYRHGEVGPVRHDTMSGEVLPLGEIVRRVVPRMPGYDYLGPEYDAASKIYRLKFMRAGSLVWVDVDGRTGAIIRRLGD